MGGADRAERRRQDDAPPRARGLVPFAGEIRVDGRDGADARRRELARLVALVPQIPETPPELTVAEYVLLGRTPHIGYLGDAKGGATASRPGARSTGSTCSSSPSAASARSAAASSSASVLARALAQEASILLLDEPTSALDLGRQQRRSSSSTRSPRATG